MVPFISVLSFFMISNQCLFMPAGIAPREAVTHGGRLYGFFDAQPHTLKVAQLAVEVLPKVPHQMVARAGVMQSLWEKLPAPDLLHALPDGVLYYMHGGALFIHERGVWRRQSTQFIEKADARGRHLAYLAQGTLVVRSGRNVRRDILPFQEQALSLSVSQGGAVAILTPRAVHVKKGRTSRWRQHELQQGRKVIWRGKKCLVLSTLGVRHCSGGMWQRGYFSDMWVDGERVWLKNSAGLYVKARRGISRCDVGLVPGEVRRVFGGSLVLTSQGLFYSLDRMEQATPHLTLPGPVYPRGRCRAPAQTASWRSPLYSALLPKVSLTGALSERFTGERGREGLQRAGGVVLSLEWRTDPVSVASLVKEFRLQEYEQERLRWRNYHRCVAAKRVASVVGALPHGITKELLSMRLEQLSTHLP